VLVAELQRRLIEAPAPGDPVPVIVRAATWNPEKQSLLDWLAERLSRAYGWLETSHARALVARGIVLPIIDGLDEMPDDRHRDAIDKINKHHIYRPLIVTSREQPFQEAVADVRGGVKDCAVVRVEPLARDDFTAYLRHTGHENWTGVLRSVRKDHPLERVLANPLMLYLARVEYEQAEPGRLLFFGGKKQIEHHLVHEFVPTVYPDPTDQEGDAKQDREFSCTAEQAQRWLTHLSPRAAGRDPARTDDLPTFAWWEICSSAGRWLALGTVLRGVLRWAAAGAAAVWVLSRTGNWRDSAYTGPLNFTNLLLNGPVGRLIRPFTHTLGIAETKRLGFTRSWGRVIGDFFSHTPWVIAVAALSVAAVTVLVYRLAPKYAADRPRRLRLNLARIARHAWGGIVTSTLLLLVPSLVLIWWAGGAGAFWHAHSTGIALAAIPLLGLRRAATGLTGAGETAGDISPERSFRQDREADAVTYIVRAAIVAAQTWLLCGSLLTKAYLGYAAALTLIGLLFGGQGGYASRSYADARIWLAVAGRAPWRIMSFLRDASDRGVLRQVGALYQFRHALLIDRGGQHPSRIRRWRVGLREVARRPLAALGLDDLFISYALEAQCTGLESLDLAKYAPEELVDTLDDLALQLWLYDPRRLSPRSSATLLSIYQQLARTDPETFRPGQARALIKLRPALDWDDALYQTREAVDAYRELAAADPATHLRGRFRILRDYADQLSEQRWTDRALRIRRAALRSARRKARKRPGLFDVVLAEAMWDLADWVTSPRGAVPADAPPDADESIRLSRGSAARCRDLAMRHPDRYLADYALTYRILAGQLWRWNAHSADDAWAAARESLAAFQQLAGRVQEARESLAAGPLAEMLAASPQTARLRLAAWLLSTEELPAWVAGVEDAIQRARERADHADPEALPELCWALHGLALELRARGRWVGADKLDAAAMDLNLRYLQAGNSQVEELDLEYLRDWIFSLANHFWEHGRHAEALSAADTIQTLFPGGPTPAALLRGYAAFASVAARSGAYLVSASFNSRGPQRGPLREHAASLASLSFKLRTLGLPDLARAAAALAAAAEAIAIDAESGASDDSAHAFLRQLRAIRQALAPSGASQVAQVPADPATTMTTPTIELAGEGEH
jgi:hypothetical protein